MDNMGNAGDKGYMGDKGNKGYTSSEGNVTSNLKNISKDSNGIGMRNVINRLKLYYQRDDVFEIESEGKNKGTTVRILIPISEKNITEGKEFEQ